MFKLFNNLLLNPPDAPGSGGSSGSATLPSGSIGKEEMIDFLGDDDNKGDVINLDKDDKSDDNDDKDDEEKPIKAKKSDKEAGKNAKDSEDTPEDTEDDELADIEDELDEPDDEKLELTTPVRRSEILKKYPKLFKDFPYLEKAYYREQQFTELLPTIQDAKTAVEKSETLDNFEKDLMSGNTELILRAVKDGSPKAFAKIADDYLTTLAKVDEKAYHHVIGNTIKHTIRSMVEEGRSSQNDALQNAALILNQFVFGKSQYEPPSKLSGNEKPEENNEKNQLDKERSEFLNQRFETNRTELNTKVNNSIKATINEYIDPKSTMSDYVRKNASREAMENLEKAISKDSRFKLLVDKLWEKAISDNFSSDSIARIKSAFLSKSKTLLPTVIKQARNEALKGMGKRISNNEDKDDTRLNRKSPQDDKPRSNNSDRGHSKSVPRGMTSLDFLMSDD